MVQASFKAPNGSNKTTSNGELRGNICILPISVGQSYHAGENGRALLRLVASTGFSKVIIILADTLQRYTIAGEEDRTPADCIDIAREKGNAWLEWLEEQKRQDKAIAALPIVIIRWGSYENQITSERKIVEGWANTDHQSFKHLLVTTAAGFLKGAAGRKTDITGLQLGKIFEQSLVYLMEEAAVAVKWQSELVLANPEKKVYLAYPREPNPIIGFVLNKAEAPHKLEAELLIVKFGPPTPSLVTHAAHPT